MTTSSPSAAVAIVLTLCSTTLGLAACSAPADGGAAAEMQDDKAGKPAGAQIHVLSNRADLISGGDALVEVILPAGATEAKVLLNDVDVSSQFGLRANGRYMGRLTGLALGDNVLVAKAKGGPPSHATITNYPNGGPLFSGPQIQPWSCQAGAVDAQCNQPAQYKYLYKSTDPRKAGLQPYDPARPPADVATTTTDEGVTVPFIVRQETGYQDRDQYVILALFQPGQGWEPWSPQAQWNHKVLVTHGGGCGTAHGAGNAPLNDFSGTIPAGTPGVEQSYITALGRGFAVMSTALDNLGHNCNVVLAAESLVMAKERLVEQYGPIRYTIGTGCSGGSITQMMVANAYPGVYQGSITTCAYPDVFSTGAQFADLHMMRLYFNDTPQDCTPLDTSGCSFDDALWLTHPGSPAERGIVWTENQMAEVEGHISHLNAIVTDEAFFKGVTSPTGNCAGPDTYHPANNPDGVRCGLMDFMVNVLGTRAPEVWSPMEIAAGFGFAGNPIDNVGIQYGLNALRRGRITPAQFVDLNRHIGGLDIDIGRQAARTAADQPALANVYRSGALNQANNLNRLAIINVSGPDPGAAHDTVHGFWTRWRIDREHGNHDNHVVWAGPVPILGDVMGMQNGLLAMDRWLAAVEQDTRDIPLAGKLTANKPADLHDQCTDGLGHAIAGPECLAAYEPVAVYSSPRAVAGGPKTDDAIKCVLKPLNRADDYGPLGLLTFTDAEWAQLQAAFPGGVCDYAQPGVDQQGAIEWLSYQDAAGNVIHGGAPLPAAPERSGGGWASPTFAPFAPGQ